jgi:hypothetical protein
MSWVIAASELFRTDQSRKAIDEHDRRKKQAQPDLEAHQSLLISGTESAISAKAARPPKK